MTTRSARRFTFDAQMPAHNVTVYAKWIQGGYTVTLDPDGGSMGGYTNPVNVVYNGRVPEPTIKREGYELIGWYTNKEKTKPYTFTYQLNKDTANTLGITTTPGGPAAENGYTLGTMNLYAKWRHVLEGASGITVVYDAGTGNKVNSDDQHTYTDPTKYQDQATASATGAATYGGKDGLKFQYWELTKKDGTKVKVYPGDTFTVDYNDAARSDNTDVSSKDKYVYTVTLKAVYDKGTPEQTQVIFDANGGSGEGYVPNATTNTNQSAASYDVNTPINIPTATLTREGYEFLGWSGTKKDEWTQEEWDAATEVTAETDLSNTTGNTYKLADGVTYYADNLSGFAESGDKTNTLYACWKPKYVTLVIQKEMSGAQANLEKGFTFTVAGADGTSKEGYTATTTELKDSTADTPDSPAKDGQFAAVTELSKDRTTVRLRWGDKVTITEGDHVGYKTSYSVSNGNGTDDKNGTIDRRKKLVSKAEAVGVVFESKKKRDYELPAFIDGYLKMRGATIDNKAAQMMADHIGADLSRLTSEMDKVLLSLPENDKRVTPEVVEEQIGVSKDFNAFELRNAIITRNVFKANQILKYFDKNPMGREGLYGRNEKLFWRESDADYFEDERD